jgi:CheY-like chemotaxis protein
MALQSANARSFPLHKVIPPAAKGVLAIVGLLSYFSCDLACAVFPPSSEFPIACQSGKAQRKSHAGSRICGYGELSGMAKLLGRLLIVDDQRDFARLVAAIAERLGFATRILSHTLDFQYVMQHWHPDFVAVQMAMPDQQELDVLEYLEKARYPGTLLFTGDVEEKALNAAATVARQHGLAVVSILTKSSPSDQIEHAMRQLRDLALAA